MRPYTSYNDCCIVHSNSNLHCVVFFGGGRCTYMGMYVAVVVVAMGWWLNVWC